MHNDLMYHPILFVVSQNSELYFDFNIYPQRFHVHPFVKVNKSATVTHRSSDQTQYMGLPALAHTNGSLLAALNYAGENFYEHEN